MFRNTHIQSNYSWCILIPTKCISAFIFLSYFFLTTCLFSFTYSCFCFFLFFFVISFLRFVSIFPILFFFLICCYFSIHFYSSLWSIFCHLLSLVFIIIAMFIIFITTIFRSLRFITMRINIYLGLLFKHYSHSKIF